MVSEVIRNEEREIRRKVGETEIEENVSADVPETQNYFPYTV